MGPRASLDLMMIMIIIIIIIIKHPCPSEAKNDMCVWADKQTFSWEDTSQHSCLPFSSLCKGYHIFVFNSRES
jgi:hypothetical protein